MDNAGHGADPTQKPSSIGLLPLVEELENSFKNFHSKKVEELEYKILEQEDIIKDLQLKIGTLKAESEEKDIELCRLN